MSKQYKAAVKGVVGLIATLAATVPLQGNDAMASEAVRYSYDALGRLVKVEKEGSTAFSISGYTYDAAGNRSNVTVAAPPVVLNGDFENPGLTNFAYSPAAPNLRFYNGAGIARNGDSFGFPTPWSGNQVAFVQANGGQAGYVELKAVNLTLGRRYQFAFAAAQRPGFPANSMKIYIGDRLFWDGPPESSARFTAYPTESFVADTSTVTIRFASTPTSYDSAFAIDAISIQPVN